MNTTFEQRIRPATTGDLTSLAELSIQLGYPTTTEETGRRLLQLQQRDDHAIFVAEVSGRVVGWIHVHMSLSLVVDQRAEIGGLVVDERMRGKAIGGTLVKAAEQWSLANGCPLLRVRSNAVRSDAHGFYEKLGYAGTKSQRVFERRI